MDSENLIVKAVMILVPMILSLSVHEYAHARVAFALGDDTAASRGRMTLNPLSHIDLFGTILIPLFSLSTGWAMIGWAKPVPVSPWRLTRRMSVERAHALVAVAGPLSNILLAIIAGFAFHAIGVGTSLSGRSGQALSYFIQIIFFMNIGLAVFNFLPLYPLDGSRLLPPQLQMKMARYSFLVFIGFLLMINFAPGILIVPIQLIASGILWLTGVPFG